MRGLRGILGIVGGVLLLALIGVVVAVFTVDPHQLISPVLARVKAATGRDIAVVGRIELRIGFAPRIVADDVRVGNAPWGKAPNLLTTRQLEMQVALLPLLRRRLELIRLDLVEPVIALERNREGRGNWELGAAPDAGAAPAGEVGPGALAIGELGVTRGQLTYRDVAGGAETRVAIEALVLRARDRQSPIEAKFRGAIDAIPVAVTAKLGPLALLAEPGAPYPVSAQGEVAGRKTAVALKVRRAGALVELQDIDVSYGASDLKGRIEVRGDGANALWTVNLSSSALDIKDLPATPAPAHAKPAAKPAAGAAAASRYVFSEAAISFDALRAGNATGEITIGRLALAGGRALARVHARFTLREGRLDAPAVEASGYGGTLSGSVTVDAARGRSPAIGLRLEGRGLDLAALLDAAGVKREVRGGKTNVSIDVAMHGDSPRQWVSGITGRAQAVIGPATLVNAKLDPALKFDQLAAAVNPFRTVDPATELQCAVARLPLAGGVARIDRSIAMETKQIDVAMSGTLDFRDETLDLSIRPRIRKGIPVQIPQIAELVRFRGTFAAPAVTVDAVASLSTIARVGAALGTGGLSLLGESIFAPSAAGAGACDVALGKAAPAPAKSGTAAPKSGSPPTGADEIGKVLKGLFGR